MLSPELRNSDTLPLNSSKFNSAPTVAIMDATLHGNRKAKREIRTQTSRIQEFTIAPQG